MEVERIRRGESKDRKADRWTNGESNSFSSTSDISQDSLTTNATPMSVESNASTSLHKICAQNFSGLIKIDLSNQGLTKLEVRFDELKNLEELRVDRNRLERLPDDLKELTSLKLLDAAENRLATLPEGLENLSSVEVLCLAKNKLSDLPDACINLQRLRHLDLSNNILRAVPSCLTQGLPLLQVLDLSHNRISNFSSPPCSKILRKLILAHNLKNDNFPGWLLSEKFSSQLEELVLDRTSFSAFEIPAGGMPAPMIRLKKLSMVKCGLSDVVFERISRSLVELEILSVGNGVANREGNVFWTMPVEGFANPDKIKEIYIQAVGLPAIPRAVNRLGNLRRLDVSRNSISFMPEEICELEKLEFLNAAQNSLYALPQSIGKLVALKLLFLESNKLSSLPDSTECLENLEFMDLYNNEFLEFPAQLKTLPNLKALDVEGNIFATENLQIGNINYLEARNILRSTSNTLILRTNDPKIFSESDDVSYSSSEMGDPSIADIKFSEDTNLNDVEVQENWDISDDSADEFDPTAQPRIYGAFSSLSISPVYYYGNFCPADLHCARVKDQLAAVRRNEFEDEPFIEAGQFDDA